MWMVYLENENVCRVNIHLLYQISQLREQIADVESNPVERSMGCSVN
jgi:hypothetical protein